MSHSIACPTTLAAYLAVGAPALRLASRALRNGPSKGKPYKPAPSHEAISGTDVAGFTADQSADYLMSAVTQGTCTAELMGGLLGWALDAIANPKPFVPGGRRRNWSKPQAPAAEQPAAVVTPTAPAYPAGARVKPGRRAATKAVPAAVKAEESRRAEEAVEQRAKVAQIYAQPSVKHLLAGGMQTFKVAIQQVQPVVAQQATFQAPQPSGPFRWAMKLNDGTTLNPSSPLALALATFAAPKADNEPEATPQQVNHIHDIEFLRLVASELMVNGHRGGGRKPIVVLGLPGTGKSSGIEALMACLGRGAKRASFGLGTRQDDLIGRPSFEDGKTGFNYGLLPEAMMGGYPLIEDEIGSAQDGILACQYEAMEPGGCLTIKENKGERIAPKHGFWLFATDNSLGTDSSGLNAQSRATSPALKSRFLSYQMPVPTEADEVMVMKAWGIDPSIAATISKLAMAMRVMMTQGQSTQSWGYRESIDLGLLMGTGLMNWKQGWSAVYGAKLPQELAIVNWEAAKRVVPSEEV